MPTKRFLLILSILTVISFTGYSLFANTTTGPEAKGCKKEKEVEKVIIEAINIGAPTYNDGNHLGCYRIYEGAAYKILYEYGAKCKQVRTILKEAIDKSHQDYSSTDKAWIMRMAFDKILGEPTQSGPAPVKTNTL